MAAENGHTAVVEVLVKAGADVNKVSYLHVHVGCEEVLHVHVNMEPSTNLARRTRVTAATTVYS